MKKALFNSLFVIASICLFSIVSCSKSSDPAPVLAEPTLTVSLPLSVTDTTDYQSNDWVTLSAKITSGSTLTKLTATVTRQGDLKSIGTEVWAPLVFELPLNKTTSQELNLEKLFSTVIPTSAKAGIYILKLVVTDSSNKTITKEIPFNIIN